MATSAKTDWALAEVHQAVGQGKLTPEAEKNLRAWLTESRYEPYASQVVEHITQAKWSALDDAFWTVIPFGTGGRRGKMYPIGSNSINDRTIGESVQGLADYVKSQHAQRAPLGCAIAYDTRHRSQHFARLSAEIMAAAGVTVYWFDGFRSTPQLSFTIRQQKCACGVMVTASHNPPSDNAVKIYGATGGQLLPPHDQGVIDRVLAVDQIERMPFDEALAAGRIVSCTTEMDRAYVRAVVEQQRPGPRGVRILYSPLHGVGATAVCPVLEQDGFADVELFEPHATPSGDFPNVPGHVANPENPEVFDPIVARARQIGADLVLASDPDCDRIGCAAPLRLAADAPWATLNGNQIGALLSEYVLERRAETLTPQHYVVKTLVTSEMIRRIADAYGVRTCGDLLVGFKWIAAMIDQMGPEHFVFGTEESHGYLAGTYVRDKDGALGAMLLAELAAGLKAQGQTLHQKLEALFWQHGAHEERTVSLAMPGSEGMQRTQALMARLRKSPPHALARTAVRRVRDYLGGLQFPPGASPEPLEGPRGDLVMIDLADEGNYVAVRPSGTEPKVKFYMFTYIAPEQLADLGTARAQLASRLAAMEADLKAFAEAS